MEKIGRYEIIRELGRGAMGVVYHAKDPKIGREIAIKTIRLADKADNSEVENLRERLFREAQSAGRLSHPGIVTIYDVDEEEGLAYITMEFVQGSTLESILRNGRVEDLAFAASVVRQTASALDYAHGQGIVHRDVKPANLMLTPEGAVKIMDFGIARISSSQLTQTGTVMGTPSYMSPEQVRGLPLDGRSDQFSLGVIGYEMLTGRKPFRGENLTSVIFKIVSEPPKRVGDICPWFSPALDEAVVTALAKTADERYVDCKSFAQDFAAGVEAAVASAPGSQASDEDSEAAVESSEPNSDSTASEMTAPAMTAYPPPPSAQSHTTERSLPPLTTGIPAYKVLSEANAGEETSGGLWKIAFLVAGLVLLLGVGTILAFNPWILRDPERTLAAIGLAGAAPAADPRVEALTRRSPVDKASPTLASVKGEAGVTASGPQQSAAEPASVDGANPDNGAAPPVAPEAPEPEAAATQPKPVAPRPEPSTPKAAAAVRRPARSATASAYFRSEPAGATITIDNRADWECKTPCRLDELPLGEHRAVFRREGFRTASRQFVLDDAGQEVVSIKLADARITVLITSDPPGGEIFIDGQKIPQKTNARIPMPAGTYEIRVEHGNRSAEQVLLVNRDEIPLARFNFK